MLAKEYLENKVKELAEKFPNTNFKYGYHAQIFTHIVVISPEADFDNNIKLDDEWIPLSFDFKALYPDQEIAFVPQSSSLSNVLIEFEFNTIKPTILNTLYEEFSDTLIHYSFPMSNNTRASINVSLVMLNSPEVELAPINEFDDNYHLLAA